MLRRLQVSKTFVCVFCANLQNFHSLVPAKKVILRYDQQTVCKCLCSVFIIKFYGLDSFHYLCWPGRQNIISM